MLTEVTTPHYGFNFLEIAKEYAEQKSPKKKIDLVVKILIFSVAAAEVIANQEAMEFMSGEELEDFVRYGPPKKGKKKPEIYRKWKYLLQKNNPGPKKLSTHLGLLFSAIGARNELMHFKPQQNQTKKILAPSKRGTWIDGTFYQKFKKTGYKVEKEGIINKITLTQARKHYKDIDNLIFEYFEAKHTWPKPKYCNEHWGKKSPFWRHRLKYK